MWPWNRASKSVNGYAPAISIQRLTPACRDMPAEKSVRLSVTTECLCFPTVMLSSSARNRSMFTSCVFRGANFGATKLSRRMEYILRCGTITLNQSSSIAQAEMLAKLPRDAEGPVFAEPWEAQAFALAVKLSEQGCFTWKEWAAALADELKAAADRGEPDDGSHYYEHWVVTLERLVTAKGLIDSAALLARKEAWADAYRHTPHGKPVELSVPSDATET